MSTEAMIYCLDANVLIQAWQKYYSPKFCSDYWDILNELGSQGRIFVPIIVKQEITRTEDNLSNWLKNSKIPILKINEPVIKCLQSIYSKDQKHRGLVDNTRNRSLADPWLIAHAIDKKAIVVTKENKETAANAKRIKIPNVCENMGVRWIDDFQFIEEIGINFKCCLK